jgi:rhomboid family GlyGly-CTERM serine protease
VRAQPIPIWTLAICAVAAVVFGAPQLEAALVYNREAIGQGELWRLVTGNLVHLSGGHLVRDLIAFSIAGALIENGCDRHFPLLCLASGVLIGAVLYLVEPHLLVYGGMSGIVTAAVTYLCLNGFGERGAYRWLCLGVLLCLATKTGVEMGGRASFFAATLPNEFVVVPASHAVGAATAVLVFALANWWSGVNRIRLRRPA